MSVEAPGESKIGEVVDQEEVFDHRFLRVTRRTIETPLGKIREQLVWDRGNKRFAVAIAETQQNQFILIEEPKYGQMKEMLVVPAGGVKKGETPLYAAQRELREETGYYTEDWIPLMGGKSMVDFPDKVAGGEHLFFYGRNATQVCDPEPERKLKLVTREQAEALLDRRLEELELEIAMSWVALSAALRYINVEKEITYG
ncbi:MAG: NUDIX hydrolase [Candidatus Hodarchaeota archaeon]